MRRRAIAVDLGICFAFPADGYAARVDENGVVHSESGLGFHVGPMAARKLFFREIMGKVVGQLAVLNWQQSGRMLTFARKSG